MVNPPSKKKKIPPELIIKTIWISTFLAMIFTIPALAIFLGIFYNTGNFVLGAVLGFGTHFVTLVFANRISNFLTKIMS
jgi:1,4-dihydroxy-2-naphthoate octaprenyltransferase